MSLLEWTHQQLQEIERGFDRRLPGTVSVALDEMARSLEEQGAPAIAAEFRSAAMAALRGRLLEARTHYESALPLLASALRASQQTS